MEKRLTMQNIADLAGVDKAVVSKIINHAGTIPASVEKVERVREIIRQYNYTPLNAARSLATRSTRQIAFLLSGMTEALFANPTYSQMFNGVVRGCQAHRYQCQADICDFMNIQEFVLPDNLRTRSIDGCILAGAMSDEALERITEVRIPLVVLCGRDIRNQAPIINRDSRKTLGVLLDYAAAHGHFQIWIADDSCNLRQDLGALTKERPQFKIRLLENDTPDTEIPYATRWGERYLALPPEERPTLIYGGDQFCCVLSRHLSRHGCLCPRDVSFLCSTETEMAECANPALTTYSQDHHQLGRRGAEVLIEMLEKNLSLPESIELANRVLPTCRFIERGSIRNLSIRR